MLAEALNRTLLLMRTDLTPDATDEHLLTALTSVRLVIEAGSDVTDTHSGQSAIVTAALLMARSGHEVWIDAPETTLLGTQPPLRMPTLIAGLVDIGGDLLPGHAIHAGRPKVDPDAIMVFGLGTAAGSTAPYRFLLAADNWSASIVGEPARWRGEGWPIGGMAAGALAAGEAFKIAMRALRRYARSPEFFDDLYAPCHATEARLATADLRPVTELPPFDFVSAGAIANAAFYALHRLPGVQGEARALDDDRSALSNLNRNALLIRSALNRLKAEDLARYSAGLIVRPQIVRFAEGMPLADAVLVGVDHIPSRWAAQRAAPSWLGIGATEGFSVLVSSHEPGRPCAGCLHPAEPGQGGGAIPTAAFVSFWSGLLLVARWLSHLAGRPTPAAEQQYFFSALRPESMVFSAMPVQATAACPVGCHASSRGRPEVN